MGRILLIFDIDGTLLVTGGGGRGAVEKACRLVLSDYGVKEIPPLSELLKGIEFAGRTDLQIFGEILKKFLPKEQIRSAVWKFARYYFSYLPGSLQSSGKGTVLPGVRETLNWLKRRDDVVMALGTGNFKRGAQVKLKHYGLDSFFGFGGFAEDGETRAELLQVAVERAESYSGHQFRRGEIWVIGDTVRDIRAARAIGACAIAVATGTVSWDELKSEGPDLLWEDMSDGIDKFSRLLGGNGDN